MFLSSKRGLLLLLTVLMLIISCGGDSQDNTVVLAVGGAPSEIDFWEKTASECEEKTGIRLQLIRQPTDTDQRRQNLVTSLRARKSTPDIFLMDVAWIAQFAASEWLEPLEPYMKKHNLPVESFFEPVVRQADTYNDKLIALPVYVDGGLLYYRKDLLQKYGYSGPPATWDELVCCALKITEEERKKNRNFTGFVWQGAQYEGLVCNFLEFAGSNNGGLVLSESQPVFDTEQNRIAVKFMRDLIHTHKLSPSNTYTNMKEEEVRLVFQNGNALFERNWPYAWKLHQASDSPVKNKTGISLLPHFEGGKPAAALGGWHIGLSRFSKNKEKAFTCIGYILSSEVQTKFVTSLGWNSGRVDIYDNVEVQKTIPHAEILKSVFGHAVARPLVPHYSYMSSVLQRYLNAVMAGRMELDKAFTECESELGKIVSQYSNQ